MLAIVVQVRVAGFHNSAGKTPVAGSMPPITLEPPVARTVPSGRRVRFRCVRG
jgi:hypothetical protein